MIDKNKKGWFFRIRVYDYVLNKNIEVARYGFPTKKLANITAVSDGIPSNPLSILERLPLFKFVFSASSRRVSLLFCRSSRSLLFIIFTPIPIFYKLNHKRSYKSNSCFKNYNILVDIIIFLVYTMVDDLKNYSIRRIHNEC